MPKIVDVDETSVSLKWSPPKDDGGSDIYNYVIEYRYEGAYKWLRANDEHVGDTSFTVKNLKTDSAYEFQIAAENKAGVGPYSGVTMPVKVEEKIGDLLYP